MQWGFEWFATNSFPFWDSCNNCLCRCKQFGNNCSKPVVCFKNQSKNYRVDLFPCYYIALNLVLAKVFFCWCSDTACIFVILFRGASVMLCLSRSVRLWESKGKINRLSLGKLLEMFFRNILKLFWASLLSIASSCFNELYNDELTFEVGLLFPRSQSSISCYLLTLILHFRISIWTSLFLTNLLILRIWSFFWKHSWECCNTQILKFQGCGITDEMYMILFWETSELGFSQCHSSIMCSAAATRWKFSETPCVDSS